MNADTPSSRSPLGLPRPELHFVRTRGDLEEIDERELLSILIGNLVETDADHVWIGEVRSSFAKSPDHPERTRLTTSTRAVRISLMDGCVPEHVSERAVAAFMSREAILDSFGPHEAWSPTAQEWRVIESALDRKLADPAWFLLVAGPDLLFLEDTTTIGAGKR